MKSKMEDNDTNITTVFHVFGLLEQIVSFLPVEDILEATLVSRRWKEAGRSDCLWESLCRTYWSDKSTMTHYNSVPSHEPLPLFFRPYYHPSVIERLSVKQIRSIFSHPLLERERRDLAKCCEKSEMLDYCLCYIMKLRFVVQNSIPFISMNDVDRFQKPFFYSIWFGAYASSVVDSKRVNFTEAELCCPHGFDTFFKISDEEIFDESDLGDMIPYHEGHRPGILLYPHSVCYFERNQDFSMQMKDPMNNPHPTNLKWSWMWEQQRYVQVGPYPHLKAYRRDNWGWKLENPHVVLMQRQTKWEPE